MNLNAVGGRGVEPRRPLSPAARWAWPQRVFRTLLCRSFNRKKLFTGRAIAARTSHGVGQLVRFDKLDFGNRYYD